MALTSVDFRLRKSQRVDKLLKLRLANRAAIEHGTRGHSATASGSDCAVAATVTRRNRANESVLNSLTEVCQESHDERPKPNTLGAPDCPSNAAKLGQLSCLSECASGVEKSDLRIAGNLEYHPVVALRVCESALRPLDGESVGGGPQHTLCFFLDAQRSKEYQRRQRHTICGIFILRLSNRARQIADCQ